MISRTPDAMLGARLRDGAEGDPARPANGDVAQLLFLASQEPMPREPSWSTIERNVLPQPLHRRGRWAWPAIALTSIVMAASATAGPALWRWLRPDVPELTPVPTVRPYRAAAPTPGLLRQSSNEVGAVMGRPARAAKPRPRAVAMVQARSVVPAEPAGPSSLAQESRLLGEAITALRKDNSPTLALQRLDEYAQRFPAGELGAEARHTKVQALLMQKRTAPALALLDEMTFSSRARDMEALTLRGELRAQAHRCAQAEEDFATVLSRTGTGALAERALFGRATCLREQGQTAAARATLEEYLQRFAAGAHVAQAKRALGR
ncbi:MAG: tetratricopeptide repeat protein [Deltaproteobacteria bacterium]|nr:tetratricopeptide repeat protein [Deltaproteobacteria bacterium]